MLLSPSCTHVYMEEFARLLQRVQHEVTSKHVPMRICLLGDLEVKSTQEIRKESGELKQYGSVTRSKYGNVTYGRKKQNGSNSDEQGQQSFSATACDCEGVRPLPVPVLWPLPSAPAGNPEHKTHAYMHGSGPPCRPPLAGRHHRRALP